MFIQHTSALKKIRTLFFVLFLGSCSVFYSQVKTKLDSVSKLISVQKSDSVTLRLYKTLCKICLVEENLKYGKLGLDFTEKLITNKSKEVSVNKIFEAKLYFLDIINYYHGERQEYFEQIQLNKKMIEAAEKIKDTFLLEEKYVELSKYLQKAGVPQAAFDTLFSRLKKHENISNRFSAFYYNNIGYFYYNNYSNEKALYYFQKAYTYYLETKKYEAASEILSRISEQYDLLGQQEKAIKSCLENLKLIEKLEDKSNEIDILWRLSFLYIAKKSMQDANAIIQKMLSLASETNDKNALVQTYMVMAKFYKSKNEKNKQEEYLLKCLKICEEIQNESNIVFRLTDLSVFYSDNGNYQKLINTAASGLKLAEKIKDIDSQKGFWNLLYIGYKKMNKASDALIAFEKFQIIKDSVDNFLNQSSIQTREQSLQFERKQHEMQLEQERKEIISKEEKQKQNIIRNALIIGLILISIVVLFIYKNYRLKKLSNQSLSEQNQIIILQKQEVESQKHLVEEKQKEILDSIHYAKRLQEAILPPLHFINEHVPNNFVLYQPKDVVAGDFYWAEIKGDKFFIAAADSTGHGVPGAMVSVVCSNALNRTINEFGITDTGKILDKTRELVLETFAKGNSEVKDGMDISLLCVDKANHKAFWSGANNPLWYIQNNEIHELKADKQPIGKTEITKPFTTHEIALQDGMQFYLFTDGFADQFGGPKGKKFMYKQLENLLISISHESMEIQKQKLEDVFKNWKGDLEQVDDVCMIGVRI